MRTIYNIIFALWDDNKDAPMKLLRVPIGYALAIASILMIVAILLL